MNTSHPEPLVVKPTLRGVFHQWAAPAALLAGLALVGMAKTTRDAVGAGVFALSLTTLFTVSATYHRISWEPVARARMRRLDHASIFLLIAGTYTPIGLLGLPASESRSFLTFAWAGAILGILKSLFWVNAPKPITAAVAVFVGWTILPYFIEVRRAVPGSVLMLVGLGGILYTLGAVAYATKRPNPVPGVLGYHEVFHALTIIAATLHFIAVLQLVRG